MIQVNSDREALFLAIQMEKAAIRLYERAELIFPAEPASTAAATARAVLEEEKGHLADFQQMTRYLHEGIPDGLRENELILSAAAEGILFEGGLMKAVRDHLFDSPSSLMDAVVAAEQKSAELYRAMAAQAATAETRALLNAIAQEETEHLAMWTEWRDTLLR